MDQIVSVMEEKQEEDLSKQEDLSDFLKNFETLKTPEEKLRSSITFMREALSQSGTPNFKGFWEVRKACLPLFKEPLPGPIRSQLWEEYIELTREGRRLKNLLDEETAFAVEQIDLAVAALEEEIRRFHEDPASILEKAAAVEFPEEPAALEGRYAFYQDIQSRLNLLNVFAGRVNSLRKELIKTEMRIRQKNKFFQRLSDLGDQVFPPRKELIREISEAFMQDVDRFIKEYFSDETFSYDRLKRSVFFFREEIKTLQAIAKILTLNTHAFSVTRESLSHCWDKLKGMEKELKKEYAEQKQKSAENVEKVHEKIEAFKESYAKGGVSPEEGYKELESISRWMREIDLTKMDVRILKDELREAKKPVDAKHDEALGERKLKEAEFEKARKEKLDKFKEDVENLKDKIGKEDSEKLSEELEEYKKSLSLFSISKSERQQLDRTLKAIRDQIEERKQQALLALSEDDRAAIENLKEVLKQRKERRKEIKNQIEEYRKIIGGSGLDFEKAMRMGELMALEKESLSKVDEGIEEIEKKIRDFKKKSF